MALRSRLARKQKLKDTRRAVLFIALTLGLALALIFVGIPVLIRVAVFLGNLRASSKLPEKSDTIPPSPPRLITSFEATNSAQFSLKGYAEPGATIKLSNSGLSLAEVVVDTDGLFIVKDIELTLGRNEIMAVAEDAAGNESQPSIPAVIEYDTSAPKLTITNPENGATITDLDNQIKIQGQTEEGAKLIINDRLVIVDPEGSFNYQYSLKEGENIFNFTVRDKAGNQAKEELKVNYSP